MVFDEVLVQSVLTMGIKFVSLLNSIPASPSHDQKYKQAFTECLFANTHNLQRTLRRSLFKCIFNTESKKEILHS